MAQNDYDRNDDERDELGMEDLAEEVEVQAFFEGDQEMSAERDEMQARWPREFGWRVDLGYQVDGLDFNSWLAQRRAALWTVRGYVALQAGSQEAGEGSYRLMGCMFNVNRMELAEARDQIGANVGVMIERKLREMVEAGLLERDATYAAEALISFEPQAHELDMREMEADVERHIPATLREEVTVQRTDVPVAASGDDVDAGRSAFIALCAAMRGEGIAIPEPAQFNSPTDYADAFLDALRAFERSRGYEPGTDPLVQQYADSIGDARQQRQGRHQESSRAQWN